MVILDFKKDLSDIEICNMIYVTSDMANINIINGEFAVTICGEADKEPEIECYINNSNELRISVESACGTNCSDITITICIPKGMNIQRIDGSVNIGNITISLSECVGEFTKIRCLTGNIDIQNIPTNSMIMRTSAGNMSIGGELTCDTSIDAYVKAGNLHTKIGNVSNFNPSITAKCGSQRILQRCGESGFALDLHFTSDCGNVIME